jgi:transcriptional regulator with XRE-family HTH domain
MESATPALLSTLRGARKARRLSQLELAMRVGVSQRLVSFVESGRARPCRALLAAWLQELDAPLALRNTAMRQAGYAPLYGSAPLADRSMDPVRRSLVEFLAVHDPLPAFVLDAYWNAVLINKGGEWLAQTLLPHHVAAANGTPLNMLRALIDPRGLAASIINLDEAGSLLLSHLRRELPAHPELEPSVDAFAAHLRSRRGERGLQPDRLAPMPPVLTTHFRTPHGRARVFQHVRHFRHAARHYARVSARRAHVCG